MIHQSKRFNLRKSGDRKPRVPRSQSARSREKWPGYPGTDVSDWESQPRYSRPHHGLPEPTRQRSKSLGRVRADNSDDEDRRPRALNQRSRSKSTYSVSSERRTRESMIWDFFLLISPPLSYLGWYVNPLIKKSLKPISFLKFPSSKLLYSVSSDCRIYSFP